MNVELKGEVPLFILHNSYFMLAFYFSASCANVSADALLVVIVSKP